MTLFVVARAYLKSLPPKNVVYHTVNSVTKGGRFPRTPTHPGKRYSISLYKHDGRFRQDKGGVGLCIDKQSSCVYWLLPPGSSNQAAGLSSTCRVRLCSLIVFFFSSPRTIESYVHNIIFRQPLFISTPTSTASLLHTHSQNGWKRYTQGMTSCSARMPFKCTQKHSVRRVLCNGPTASSRQYQVRLSART